MAIDAKEFAANDIHITGKKLCGFCWNNNLQLLKVQSRITLSLSKLFDLQTFSNCNITV